MAFAANECGVGATVTCTSAGNVYPGGITYGNANQTVTLEEGVVVNSGGNVGVNLTGTGTQTLNIASGVVVATTGNGADAVDIAGLPSGAITVNGAGSIVSTAGNDAWGFGLWGFSSITATVGDVTVSGDGTVGVWAQSFFGPVSITTGTVLGEGNNTGNAVNGILAQNVGGAGASGAVTIDSSGGSVTLTGADTSHAIAATSTNGAGGGNVTVTTGDVSTVSNSAFGIFATTTGTGDDGIVTVDTTAGTVSTAGSSARGIHALTGAGGSVVIRADGVSTEGSGAIGIYAQTGTPTVGLGAIDITAGDIGTLGANAHAIQAASTGTIAVDSTAATISTEGTGARGITIDKTGTGAVTVDAGTISTTGDDGQGIHVVSGQFGVGNGGAVTITANSISTTGDSNSMLLGGGADGIEVITLGAGADGKVVIDTSVGALPDTLGSVSTAGDRSTGIKVQSGRPDVGGPIGGGAIEITAGNVSTEGASAAAIDAQTEGSGEHGTITIDVLGTISTKGEIAESPTGPPPNGISAVSWGGGDVSVTARDIFTEGGFAAGIFAQSGNGPLAFGDPPQVLGASVTIDTTGGTISTKGAASSGIVVGNTSGTVMITTADIMTEGFAASGIVAGNSGPDSDMTIDTTAGTITTTGQFAHGISAGTASFVLGTSNAGLLTLRAGDILTEGQGSNAITAGANNGAIEIDVVGEVATSGTGSTAISVTAGGTTTSTIAVNGSITTTGDASHGIVASGPPGANANTITVNGAVSVEGAGSNGIQITGIDDLVTVSADGSVTATGVAVQLQQLGEGKVVNAGTISSTGGTAVRFLGAFVSTFDNDGTVTGDVLLGAGADTAILGTNSSMAGNIDGEGGSDALRLVGAGLNSIDVATILNFETGEKAGAGTWTLTGTNAAFAQVFAVNAGTLRVTGTVANTGFTVNDGAFLGGSGALGALTAGSGGTVAPGNSIGVLEAATAMFDAGSIFEVEIDPLTSDKLVVTGTATISSDAMVKVLPIPGAYSDGFEYLILDASTGARVGEFGGIVESSAFLDFTLDHDKNANQVWLTVLNVAVFPDVADTPNQIATAEALQALGPGNPIFDAILVLDEDEARNAFDLASGEVHATLAGALVDDSRFVREAVLDRVRQRFDTAFRPPALGYASEGDDAGFPPSGPVVAAWANGFATAGAFAGDGNAAAFGRRLGGAVGGVDWTLAEGWRFGLAGGLQSAGIDVPDRASTAGVDTAHVAAYGGLTGDAFAVRFGGAYAWHKIATVRTVEVPGFSDRLTASYGARTAQVFGEAGVPMEIGGVAVEPFAGLAHVHVATDVFAESGGAAALSAPAGSVSVTHSSLGARFAAAFSDGRTRLYGMAAWQHTFGSLTPMTMPAFAGGDPFAIAGVPIPRDAVRVELGVDRAIGDSATASILYSGLIASGVQDHGVKGKVAVRF